MSGADITVKIDDRQFQQGLKDLKRKIPFAVAWSLTQTAKVAQAYVKDHVGQHVTLRTNWVKGGIRITPATRSTMTSSVDVRDPVMAALATGGPRPDDGGSDPMIPQKGKGMPRATPTTVTRKSKWPGKLTAIREKSTGASQYFVGQQGNIYRKTGRLAARKRYHPGSGPMVRLKGATGYGGSQSEGAAKGDLADHSDSMHDWGRYAMAVAWLNPKRRIILRQQWPLEAEVWKKVQENWERIAAQAIENALNDTYGR